MKLACSPTLCLLPLMNRLQKCWPNVAKQPCYNRILPEANMCKLHQSDYALMKTFISYLKKNFLPFPFHTFPLSYLFPFIPFPFQTFPLSQLLGSERAIMYVSTFLRHHLAGLPDPLAGLPDSLAGLPDPLAGLPDSFDVQQILLYNLKLRYVFCFSQVFRPTDGQMDEQTAVYRYALRHLKRKEKRNLVSKETRIW